MPAPQIRFICLVVQLFTLLRLYGAQLFPLKKNGTKQISEDVCIP